MDRLQQRTEELSAHGKPMRKDYSELAYGELIQSIAKNLLALTKLETALVRTEVQDKIASEILITRRLIVGAGLMIVGCAMFLVAIVAALATVIPPWLSALVLAVLLTSSGAITIFLVWNRHCNLAQVGSELKERLLCGPK
jgi:hypothetical protein